MTIDLQIHRHTAVQQTPRVLQASGIFDLPPDQRSGQSWHHKFTLPDQWHVGVIVGPSGAGKSTLAREAFGDRLVAGWPWPDNRSILDGFPAEMGIKEITGLLSSVGFNSPPSWLRPFAVLSNGEQFRVTVARTLAEHPDLAVVDEFTSVVDRQVAQLGSAAVAKAVRRRGQQFVAVTCHYDVIDWLEPDWVYEPHTGRLQVNVADDGGAGSAGDAVPRGSLWRRPPIRLEIARVHRSAWELFKQHHYLSGDLHRSSKCFVGFVDGRPAAFVGVLSFPHAIAPAWREHRAVCLPDFQGVGIGNAMSEFVASLFAGHKRYISTTSHPAMIRHRTRSTLWRTLRKTGMVSGNHRGGTIGRTMAGSVDRLTAGFRYVGPARPIDAAAFGLFPLKA